MELNPNISHISISSFSFLLISIFVYYDILFLSNLFADILGKIFKKKIKRNKAGGADEDEEDDDDDDDEDDDDEVQTNCKQSLKRDAANK